MGDEVARLGFGALAIGSAGYGDVTRDDALAALETYVNSGGTFIDTARDYGKSEEILGEFIRTHKVRDRLFICSKSGSLSEEEIRRDLDRSLAALGIDCIDLHYLHNPPGDPAEMDRVLTVFDALKREGKIRGVGASIKGPNVTAATQDLCRQYIATRKIDAIQIIYSVLRQGNRSVFEEAQSAGVAVVGRTVLENGYLTGNYLPGHCFAEGDHRRRWGRAELDRILQEVVSLEKMPCRKSFDNLTQLAIRFAYEETGLTNVIVGARSARQVGANLAAATKSDLPCDWSHELIERYAAGEVLGNL